jgi:hypothetical protein
MQKNILTSFIFLVILFITLVSYLPVNVQIASANQSIDTNVTVPTTEFLGCNLASGSLLGCLGSIGFTIVRFLLGVVIILSVIMIVWAGFTYVMSGTDDKKRDAAKNRILYAVIGLVIAFAALAVVTLLKNTIGGNRITS